MVGWGLIQQWVPDGRNNVLEEPVLFHALEDLGYTDNGKDLQLTRLFYQRGGPEIRIL